jgi:2-polyprenyl-6-methoxyphenol hydroxylase-like FAD-dependent oxidoreductase
MSTNGSGPPTRRRRGRNAGEHFDVIIVGARCAGSPLATLLARAGLKVAVVEQATFPKEVLSSHLFEADGIQFLDRLGVLGAVEKTGVRLMKHVDMRFDDFRTITRFPLRFDDRGGAAFLQRHLLDSILSVAADEAGAVMHMNTKVVEVLWDRGRVYGVRAQTDSKEMRLLAPLVVGADGRSSTVAYMCHSRKYNVVPNERAYYFTFFEGAYPEYDDTFVFHRWGDRMVWGGPANDGLYLVGVSPEVHERDYFRRNTEAGLLAHMRSCDTMEDALADARIATKIAGIVKFDGYFREASGPGWVLVGDAGHFKDPALGRGIGDAWIQVQELAPAIVTALDGSGPELDTAMRRWGEWRDQRFDSHFFLASQLGRAGSFPTMVPEAMRAVAERGDLDRFFEIFFHRAKYDDVFPLRDLSAATLRMLGSGRTRSRASLVREAVGLLGREPRRRLTRRYPAMAPADLSTAPRDRVKPPQQRAPRKKAPAAKNGNGSGNGASRQKQESV